MSTLPAVPASPAPRSKADLCGPKVSVKLPVLGSPPRSAHGHVGKSKMGKWRAGVLILVHLVFAVHVAYWLSGPSGGVRATVTPVEPSESMSTLEAGAVNAGFVFFVTALLSTLVLGRFFCGWGCHVVALQDLCGWAMKKIGVHPKPFRSRLLLWGPLVLALYMFVWPTVRREVLTPVFGVDIDRDGNNSSLVTGLRESNFGLDLNGDGRVSKPGEPGDFVPGVPEAVVGRDLNGNGTTTDLLPEYAELPLWMGRSYPMPGFRKHFLTEDFWATFAHWTVAIPFLAICGFATVYFLGAKAFCTYGCPYGGFFAPLDRLSPLRIRVNDDCNGCGHCTAVCTSNVRVHEEVRDYGAVIDPGCMKCLDCVSVCPNDALRLGLGAPAVFTRPRDPDSPLLAQARERAQMRYDLSLREELAIGAMFLLFFLGYRGMYNSVPLLMAMGVAMVGAFMAHKSWRVMRDRNVRAPFWQLKRDGRIRPAGVLFVLASLAVAGVGVQGLATKVAYWRGEAIAERLGRTDDAWQAAGRAYKPSEQDVAAAKDAITNVKFAGRIGDGGIGFKTTAAQHERLSYLYAYTGDNAQAEAHLLSLLRAADPKPQWVGGLFGFFQARQAPPDEAIGIMADLQRRWPDNDVVRAQHAALLLNTKQASAALTILNEGLKNHPGSALLHERLAQALLVTGQDRDGAIEALRFAAEHEPTAERWGILSRLYRSVGRESDANEAAAKARALSQSPQQPPVDGGISPSATK